MHPRMLRAQPVAVEMRDGGGQAVGIWESKTQDSVFGEQESMKRRRNGLQVQQPSVLFEDAAIRQSGLGALALSSTIKSWASHITCQSSTRMACMLTGLISQGCWGHYTC